MIHQPGRTEIRKAEPRDEEDLAVVGVAANDVGRDFVTEFAACADAETSQIGSR